MKQEEHEEINQVLAAEEEHLLGGNQLLRRSLCQKK
jgi:hypothetical protein